MKGEQLVVGAVTLAFAIVLMTGLRAGRIGIQLFAFERGRQPILFWLTALFWLMMIAVGLHVTFSGF